MIGFAKKDDGTTDESHIIPALLICISIKKSPFSFSLVLPPSRKPYPCVNRACTALNQEYKSVGKIANDCLL